jgi:tetratricopeptide (TPR) repeat protein
VALDLLERHDEAASLLQDVERLSDDEELRGIARYNRAVTRLRKYEPAELQNALSLFQDLVPTEGNARKSDLPLHLFALAGVSSVCAHKLIFWEKLLFAAKSSSELDKLRGKAAARSIVDSWYEEALSVRALLASRKSQRSQHKRTEKDKQLEWLALNALGNAHLNYALYYLIPPFLYEHHERAMRQDLLQSARENFHNCARLLPPGVETLTNLGTTLFALDEYSAARDYFQKATDLNPRYEYGYYRLAQLWDREGQTDKVLEVLQSLNSRPNIPSFQRLAAKYSQGTA